jgi:hypothetical protein
MTASHLLPEVAEMLDQPDADRIKFCKTDRWVSYSSARRALDEMDNLRTYPKNVRPNNVLIVARSGNGKSSILEYFANRHPVLMTEDGSPIMPVLRIEMPESPDESEFWSLILWGLGISHREGDRAPHKKRQAKSAMLYAGVQLLVIDELNNVTQAGREAPFLLAAIRNLSNELRLPIVAAGTQQAINAINLDPHFKKRFDPIGLSRWLLNVEYLKFLASYEKLLPLTKPSGLASRELAPVLYGLAGDTIGQTVKLLRRAAEAAIESGTEQITPKLVKDLGWTKDGDWDAIARAI